MHLVQSESQRFDDSLLRYTNQKVLQAISVVQHVLHAAPFNHSSIAYYCSSWCGKMTEPLCAIIRRHPLSGAFSIHSELSLCVAVVADDWERSISTSHVRQLQKIVLLCLAMAVVCELRVLSDIPSTMTIHSGWNLSRTPINCPRAFFSSCVRSRIKWVACLRRVSCVQEQTHDTQDTRHIISATLLLKLYAIIA